MQIKDCKTCVQFGLTCGRTILAGNKQAALRRTPKLETAPVEASLIGVRDERRNVSATVPAHDGATQADERMLIASFDWILMKESLGIRKVGVIALCFDQIE